MPLYPYDPFLKAHCSPNAPPQIMDMVAQPEIGGAFGDLSLYIRRYCT
jgi:hypothetical protein